MQYFYGMLRLVITGGNSMIFDLEGHSILYNKLDLHLTSNSIA